MSHAEKGMTKTGWTVARCFTEFTLVNAIQDGKPRKAPRTSVDLPGAPDPKKVRDKDRQTAGISFELRGRKLKDDQGTMQFPKGLPGVETQSVSLTQVGEMLDTPCAWFFFYKGSVDNPLQVNVYDKKKCGPVLVLSCKRKNRKKCADCRFIGIQIIKVKRKLSHDGGGDPVVANIDPKVDDDTRRISPFYTQFKQDRHGDGDCFYFDWIGPVFRPEQLPSKIEGTERNITAEEWDVAIKFWLYCFKRNPCLLARIDINVKFRITYDLMNRTFSCSAIGIQTAPMVHKLPVRDDEFNDALEVWRNKTKSRIQNAKRYKWTKSIDKFAQAGPCDC